MLSRHEAGQRLGKRRREEKRKGEEAEEGGMLQHGPSTQEKLSNWDDRPLDLYTHFLHSRLGLGLVGSGVPAAQPGAGRQAGTSALC